MHRDRIQGCVLRIRGCSRELWGRLIDSDIDISEGRRKQVAGKAQALYGLAQDMESRVDVWNFAESLENVGSRTHA